MKCARAVVCIWVALLTGCSFDIAGVFYNDTANMIRIRILSPDETHYDEITVAPHLVAKKELVGNAPIAILSARSKLVAHLPARSPATAREYFDSRNNTFYYSITAGGIELVLPTVGRTWK